MMRNALFLGVLLCLFSGQGLAKTLVVDPSSTTDYHTVAEALAAAAAGDRVLLRRGTYADSFTLEPDVTLEGEETAATKLTGAVGLAEGATLQRLTITDTVTVSSIATATIRNNIFADATGSALRIDPRGTDDSAVLVVNNTFYDNEKAVEFLSASAAEIRHNLFVANGTAITRTSATWGVIENNRFHRNTLIVSSGGGSLSADNLQGDPLFVGENAASRDLHITLNSAACGWGAFGDLDSEASPDPTPAPPTGLTATAEGDNVRLAWEANTACDSAVERYRINFKTTASTDWPEDDGLAVIDASGQGSQHYTVDSSNGTLGGLPSAPATAPGGVAVSVLDGSLRVTWTPLATAGAADGYRVLWGAAADSLDHAEDAGNTSTRIIRGLTNGSTYFVAVSAYLSRKHDYAVTALPFTSSEDGESRRSNSVRGATGKSPSSPSSSSAAVSGTPDSISGNPALENKGGCFVQSLGMPATGHPLLLLVGVLGVGLLFRCWRGSLVGVLLVAASLLAPAGVRAEGPRWAFSAGGAVFYPAEDNWSDSYDSGHLWEGKLGVGLRLIPQIEIGLDGGYRRATGEVAKTDNGSVVDPPVEQTLTVIPLQAYVLLRLCFTENQWVVPYVAGGYSRYYFRHEIEHGKTTKGHQDGYHARGGLKILLDMLDSYFAERALQNWGIRNSYLTLEAQYAKVDDRGDSDANLGGMSYAMGFVLEF